MSRLLLKQAEDDKTYVEDVFSTNLYTGNSGMGTPAQSITNGIDLAGKGGLVWIKSVDGHYSHALFDTARGFSGGSGLLLKTDATDAQVATGDFDSFNSDGFSISGPHTSINSQGTGYASWTFRKARKFFDVVTYTGTGTSRNVTHGLGTTPGMIIIKRLDGGNNWMVWHRSISGSNNLRLNTTDSTGGIVSDPVGSGGVTDSNFEVGDSSSDANDSCNVTGGSYVAYLFAHDATTDGMIQCGSFTTDTGGGATVNLGWEPQWILTKASSATSNWKMYDTGRGITVDGGYKHFDANLPYAQQSTTSADAKIISSTGFGVAGHGNTVTHIYVAIRRGPMKPPTSGTQVYNAITRTGNGAANTIVDGVGFPPDMTWYKSRSHAALYLINDRLRGDRYLLLPNTQQEFSSTAYGTIELRQNGGMLGSNTSSADGGNLSGATFVHHFFRRAPGFFDVVCYTGTGAGRTVTHNLTVAPQLWMVKNRWNTANWAVGSSMMAATEFMWLNDNSTKGNDAGAIWNSTYPTATSLSVGTDSRVNSSGTNYVAYLFSSCEGVSKVGGYTGNGTSQTIDCGFTNGARFILIKRTDSLGEWFVWDSTRGIVAANDPRLALNSSSAESTDEDAVDPVSSGFIVNQGGYTNINVNNATYIFLAIA